MNLEQKTPFNVVKVRLPTVHEISKGEHSKWMS